MRVIAGKARRLQLITPKGMETRPTTDRIKETLFNMISSYIADSVFLDLFSGSGAIGIEALSRGAKEAVFVENNRNALECINENLMHTNLSRNATVLSMEVLQGLQFLEKKGSIFDVIFMDPPYHHQYEKQVLEFLVNSSLLHEDSIIIFEAADNTDINYIESMNFKIDKVKKYKTNMHVFCHRI